MKLHGIMLVFLVFKVGESFPNVANVEKIEFCSQLKCRDRHEDAAEQVCGMRAEGEGFRLRLFQDECELLKYGCNVDEADAYGLINKEYCNRSFETNYNETADYPKNESQTLEIIDGRKFENTLFYNITDKICGVTCDNNEKKEVCGIRKDVNGYRIRLFQNYCDLIRHNCENDLEFIKTDLFICKTDLKDKKEDNIINNAFTKDILNNLIKNTFEDTKYAVDDLDKANTLDYKDKYEVKTNKVKNLVVVNSKIFGQYDNINDSIDTFFAASHVFDLPLTEVKLNTRRKWIKNAGPIKVFVPKIIKPKIIYNDTLHRPTLSSCFHKCPYKCPDTYAPVCGVPGVYSREPSLVFQNHCFMDVAQCKMVWEDKSSTSANSTYVESSFLFCMGDEMNAVYRFLPAIRTLQHMGRLKKKGKFRAKLRNFRFVSEFRAGRPNFMG